MTTGDRINERLRAIDISQSELARRVGLDPSTINGLIRGGSKSSKHLHKIARVLKTSIAFLQLETDDPTAEFADEDYTAEERELIDNIRTMERQDRTSIMRLARFAAKAASAPTLHEKQQAYRGRENALGEG